jgi:HSP20 family protein
MGMKKTSIFFIFCLFITSISQASTTTYDKEQLKKDYRAFLQQLKSLNAQYKEITGEMGQVMKEEGVPAWDMGEGLGQDKKEPASPALQDLGNGAYLKETDKEMVLTADLPGFKRDSIKLSFKDGKTLMIQAQRKLDNVAKTYERSFELPTPGDQRGTSAAYSDGVLTVKVPKTASQEVVIPVR